MNEFLNRMEAWAKKLFPLGLVLYAGPIPVAHFISSVFGTIWSTVEVVGMRLAGVAIDVALIARRYRWFLFYVPAAVTLCFVVGIHTGSQPWIAAGGIILGLAMMFIWLYANTITFIIAEILNAGQAAIGKSIGFFAWAAQALGATVTFDSGSFRIMDTDAIKKSLRGTWDLMIPMLLLSLLLYLVPTWKTFLTIPGLILIVMIGLVLTISTGKDTMKTRLMWLRVVNAVGTIVVVWLIFSQVMPKTAGAVTTRTKTTDQTLGDLIKGDWQNMTCNQRIDLLDKNGMVKDSLKASEQFVMCSSMDTTFGGTNYKLTFHVTPSGPKLAGYAWEPLIKKNTKKGWVKKQSALAAQQAARQRAIQDSLAQYQPFVVVDLATAIGDSIFFRNPNRKEVRIGLAWSGGERGFYFVFPHETTAALVCGNGPASQLHFSCPAGVKIEKQSGKKNEFVLL